jgi:hypothetical protein
VREDLLEEFCLADAYTRFLPRSGDAYNRWLRIVGRTEEELPLDYVSRFAKGQYTLMPRYILAAEIVPGTRYRTNLVVDGEGLPQIMPHRGLFLFVVERAIRFCVLKGMPESQVAAKFLPAYPSTAPQTRIESAWSIGLERDTGYCTILVRGAESEARFLAESTGWLTPFPTP